MKAPAEHHSGCSIERNRRCICTYLNQWTTTGHLAKTFRQDLVGPGVLVMPDEMVLDYLRSADLSSDTMPIVISQSEYNTHRKDQ